MMDVFWDTSSCLLYPLPTLSQTQAQPGIKMINMYASKVYPHPTFSFMFSSVYLYFFLTY